MDAFDMDSGDTGNVYILFYCVFKFIWDSCTLRRKSTKTQRFSVVLQQLNKIRNGKDKEEEKTKAREWQKE